VLRECKALIYLILSVNMIEVEGSRKLAAGVVEECTALAHLNSSQTAIGGEPLGRLGEVLGKCTSLAHLDLSENLFCDHDEGAERLAKVLGECKAVAHVNLEESEMSAKGSWRRCLRRARSWPVLT